MLNARYRAGLETAVPCYHSQSGGSLVRGHTTRVAPNGLPYDHRFIASTDKLASDQGVILVDAWQLQRFRQRPRWIAMHDIYGHTAPINEVALGRVVHAGLEANLPTGRAGPSGRALVEYVQYARTLFAQEVKVLYEDGGLDDVSVRWDAATEQIRPPTTKELVQYGDGCLWVATRVDQLELSAVLIGADPGAQQVRREVLEAFERVRAGGGHQLPRIEKLIREKKLKHNVRIAISRFIPAST
jgi:hypothetical protein